MLVGEGYSVTISGRRLAALKRAVETIGDRAYPVPADVAQENQVVALLRAHAERFGRLDVVVNSAGVAGAQSSASADAGRVDHQIAVNLRGPLLVTREALPLLRKAGAEHGKALIVNLSSVAGKQGQPHNAAYSATKAGLISLTESVQREVAHEGIQATALCPGFVSTPMTEDASIAREEMLRPGDVAEAVRFLLRTSSLCLVPEIVLNRRGAVC
jgi:NAD(P)-dependent dehydrogenase (short-subunit alcohol dehydrogenase family)